MKLCNWKSRNFVTSVVTSVVTLRVYFSSSTSYSSSTSFSSSKDREIVKGERII